MSEPMLHLLCAGAAQGLVRALERRFAAEAGALVTGRFGPVGAMKEALLAGEPCDVMVVSAPMVEALVAEGRLDASSVAPLGRVRTGIAVRAGDPVPSVETPEALRAAIKGAGALHFPDPQRATAGMHFKKVLHTLGLDDATQARRRVADAGMAAMRELAQSTASLPLGCTEVSEILASEGVVLAGALAGPFELATTYSAAVASGSTQPALARAFVALLAGPQSAPVRARLGYEASAGS